MLITAPNKESQIKTCQSCIDKKLDNPRPAISQWGKGYWVCSECFNHLKSIEPLKGEVSDYSESVITSNYILSHRDEFFNHKALAVANLTYDELVLQYENNRIVLFQTNIEQEALQVRIDQYKAKKRAELGVTDKDWDKANPVDKQPSLAVAKLKEEQELKRLKAIAKQTGLTVEQVRELGRAARAQEMTNLANGQKCDKCNQLICECSSGSVVAQLKEITSNLRDSLNESPAKPEDKITKCPLCKEIYHGTWIAHKEVRHNG